MRRVFFHLPDGDWAEPRLPQWAKSLRYGPVWSSRLITTPSTHHRGSEALIAFTADGRAFGCQERSPLPVDAEPTHYSVDVFQEPVVVARSL